jgi:DNA-binding NarL/FixJ family response regulator
VVDTETLFAEAVAREFEHAGLTPALACTALGQAFDAIDGSRNCVILVDPAAEGASDDVAHERFAGKEGAKVVLWSSSLDNERVTRAVALGYRGVVSKSVRLARVIADLRCVLEGDISIDVGELPTSHRSAKSAGGEPRGLVPLTSRERQVLALLAEGMGSAEIASRLSLSGHTVRTHINNVMQKLGVHSRAEAVAHAMGRGLVKARAKHGSGAGGGSPPT